MKKIDRVETNAIAVFMDRSNRKNLYQEIDIKLKMIAILEDKLNELVDEHNKLAAQEEEYIKWVEKGRV